MTSAGDMDAHKQGRLARFFSSSLRNYSALWLLLVFAILFSFTAPGTFNSVLTVQIVLSDHVATAILALAILVPLTSGHFDFAVGAYLALSMAIGAKMASEGVPVLYGCLVAVGVTTIAGVISGFIIVKLRVNSFIATLGMSQIATAMALIVTQNQPIAVNLPYWFTTMTRGKLLGIDFWVYYMLIVAVILWFVLEHTPIGRSSFAAGGNPEAARLSGVPVDRLAWITMVVSGALAGVAGVLLFSKVGSYSAEYGPNFLFAAFAAVFFGATQVKGRPNVWGTLIALYVLAVAVAGLQLTFFGNEYWITPLFNGIALVIAVALSVRKHAGKAYRKLRKGKGGSTTDPTSSVPEPSEAVPAAVDRSAE